MNIFKRIIASYKEFLREIEKEHPLLEVPDKPDKVDEFWAKVARKLQRK